MKDKETKTLDKIQELMSSLIVDSTDKLYDAFMELDKKTQKKEFAQQLVAKQIIEYIVDIIKRTDDKTRKEVMAKYEMVGRILSAVLSYLELGLSLGYSEKVKK